MPRQTKHPGITVTKHKGRGYRVRYTDPDTGKDKWESLRDLGITTRTGARDWAKVKSEELAERRRELAMGASRRKAVPIKAMIARVIESQETGSQQDGIEMHRAVEAFKAVIRHDDQRGFVVDQLHRFADHLVGLAVDF